MSATGRCLPSFELFPKDWHPAHPAVLAVGLYDGTVLVYDVRARTKKPIYQSTVRTNKHTDPVWEAPAMHWIPLVLTMNVD